MQFFITAIFHKPSEDLMYADFKIVCTKISLVSLPFSTDFAKPPRTLRSLRLLSFFLFWPSWTVPLLLIHAKVASTAMCGLGIYPGCLESGHSPSSFNFSCSFRSSSGFPVSEAPPPAGAALPNPSPHSFISSSHCSSMGNFICFTFVFPTRW